MLPLPEQLDELLTTMRAIERALGDRTKRGEFIADHGPELGIERYEQWRTNARTKLASVTNQYRSLKRALEEAQEIDPTVQLLRASWHALKDVPDQQELRERIRLYARDALGVYFKD